MQYDTIVCSVILETLTCTLLPDNQDWQVTHIGRKAVQKALYLILRQIENVSFMSPLTAVSSVNRHSRNQQFLDFAEAL